MKGRIIFLYALVTAVPAVGASPEAEEPIETPPGEPIVITVVGAPTPASEVPFGVSVVDAAEMSAVEPADLADALVGTPGVTVREYGGMGAVSSIAVRGGKGNETLVMIDGQPINNPQGGDVNVSSVPLEDVDRVEVLPGASSALYGADASAGVVNVITRGPGERPALRFKGSWGTYDTKTVELSGGAPFGPVWAAVGGGYETADGYRINDDYEGRTFFVKSVYEFLTEHELSSRLQFYEGDVGSPGPASYEDATARLRDDDFYSNVRYGGSIADGFYVPDVAFYYNKIDREYESAMWGTRDRHENRFWGAVARNYFRPVSWMRLCAAAEFGRARTVSTSVGRVTEGSYAVVLQDELELGRLNVVGGVRYDRNEHYGRQINPRAGVRYSFYDWFSARAAFGKGFRAPTFDELFWPDTGYYVGNPNLAPEENWSYEGGVSFGPAGKAAVELTYFQSEYKNLIVNVTDEDTFVTRPENVLEAQISGIETGAEVFPLRFFGVGSPTLSVSISLTRLTDAKDETRGMRLDYRPATTLFADVGLTQPLGGDVYFIPGVNFEYVSENQYTYYDPITYEPEKRFLDPYLLVGARVRLKIYHFEPFLAVHNLTDASYQSVYDYPMPGRVFAGGVSVSY